MAIAVATSQISESVGAVTSHIVTLPAGVVAGDLLLLIMTLSPASGTVSVTWPAGWTEIDDAATGLVTGTTAYRFATGSEGGSITVTSSVAAWSTSIALRITGHRASQAPEILSTNGTNTEPNSPSLTPSWGADVNFWITTSHLRPADEPVVGAPTTYSGLIEGAHTDNDPINTATSIATKTNSVATENPGAWDYSGIGSTLGDWRAATIVIRPPASAQPEFGRGNISKAAPIRRLRESFAQRSNQYLVGQDKIHGAVGQTHSYDWPNPQRPRSIPDANTRGSGTLLHGRDQFFGDPGMAPHYDWPNPRGARPIPQAHLQTMPSVVKGADAFFGLVGPRYDWPNPRGAARPAKAFVGVRTYQLNVTYTRRGGATIRHKWPVAQQPLPIPNITVALTGLDTFFAAQGQGPRYDWPNPRIAKRFVVDHIHVNKATTSLLVDITQKQLDWPLPPRAKPRISPAITTHNRVFLTDTAATYRRNPTKITHLWPVAQQPFLFPNVVAKQSVPLTRPVGVGTLLMRKARPDVWFAMDAIINDSIYEDPPTYQHDWPNPRIVARKFEYNVASNLISTTLAPVPKPFNQNNWPNPLRPAPIPDADVQPTQIARVGYDVFFGAPGQAQTYDWPNPREPKRASTLTQWTQNVEIGLIGKDKFFYAIGQGPRYDWPNPRDNPPIPQQGLQVNRVAVLVESTIYRRTWATMIGA